MSKDTSLTPEEQWFAEKESRGREQMREELQRKATEERRKREIAGSLATDDQALIERLAALGLDGDVAPVLHLLPMVQVAWADGSVSVSERRTILEAVAAAGVAPGSKAATFIASLLESHPSEALLDEILAVMRDILAAKGLKPASLVEACQHVAQASGGLLGLGNRISSEEADAIHKVAQALGPAVDEKISSKLG
jgi:tellurite resistance protein